MIHTIVKDGEQHKMKILSTPDECVEVVLRCLTLPSGQAVSGVSCLEAARWLAIARSGVMLEIYDGYDIASESIVHMARFNTKEDRENYGHRYLS